MDTFIGLYSIWAEKKQRSDLRLMFIVCFGLEFLEDVSCFPIEPDVSYVWWRDVEVGNFERFEWGIVHFGFYFVFVLLFVF